MGMNSFLKTSEAHAMSGPIHCKAYWFILVKDTHSISNLSNLSTDCNFEFFKQLVKAVIQWKGIDGLSKSQNGSIRSVMLKVYST